MRCEVAATVAVSLAVLSSQAAADPVAQQTVELTVASSDDEGARMESLGRELLERLGVQADVRPAPERVDLEEVLAPHPTQATPLLARVWIDLTRSDRALLYLADSASARILVRQLPRSSPEMTREALGLILETAIDALLHGGEIGITRAEAQTQLGLAPKKVPPKRRPQPAPSPAIYEFGLHFAGQVVTAPGEFGWGPVLSFALEGRPNPHLGAWAQFQYRLPFTATAVGASRIRAELQGGVGRLLFCLQPELYKERVSVRFGAGPAIEVIGYAPQATDPSVTAAPGSVVVRPLFSVGALASVRVASKWSVQLGGFLDIPLEKTSFVVTGPGGKTTDAIDLAVVRPGVMVGVELP